MAEQLSKYVIFLYTALFLVIGSAHSADVLNCGNDPCRCKISEDKILDISNINSTTLQSGNLTYYFFGCKNNMTFDKAPCKGSTFCLHDKSTANNESDGTWTKLGDESNIKFQVSETGASYDIIYRTKETVSRIGLVCAQYFNNNYLFAKDITNAKNPVLLSFSNRGCLATIHHKTGMSTGSTLLVLFLVGATIYFVGGAVVLYFIRGARGREMIPNIDFWQSLPGLMKDGLIFILNGCRPMSIATAETYDRI